MSKAQASFVREQLADAVAPLRPDGRPLTGLRVLSAQRSVIESANGSVRLVWGGDAGIECVVGVKVDVGPHVADDQPGAYRVRLDVASASAWRGEDDDPVLAEMEQSLQTLADQLPRSELRLSATRDWRLWIDVVLLRCGTGEYPLPALALAVRIALRTTRIPHSSLASVQVEARNQAQGTGTKLAAEDFEIDDDWAQAVPVACVEQYASVIVLVAACGENCIIDPCAEELLVADAAFVVGVDARGKVCFCRRLRPLEGNARYAAGISPAAFLSLLKQASKAGVELIAASEEQVFGQQGLQESNGFFDILL